MLDADSKRRMAVNWFYDQFRVTATSVDRATDHISIQLPWDEMLHMAEQLYDYSQQQILRSQHADLKDEYQRYEALMYLIKSLTEHQIQI